MYKSNITEHLVYLSTLSSYVSQVDVQLCKTGDSFL